MALFETMRENTKVILWITVAAFVGLIFLAWGADFTTRSGPSQYEAGVLGKVNGEKILSAEYNQVFNQSLENYRQRMGDPTDESLYVVLRASAWDQMIERILLRQAVERHGIMVTSQEITNAILYNPLPRYRMEPSFQNEEGQFDLQAYQSWVASPRTNTLPLEHEYRELIAQEKLRMLLVSGATVSQHAVREAWLERNEKLDLAVAQIPFFRLPVETEVPEATLQAFLDERAEDYRLPARVALEYLRLAKVPTSNDTLEARSEIEEAYEEYRRGEEFVLLVQAYSQAPRDRWGGDETPYRERSEIPQAVVADAAFALEIGTVSEVLESEAGFHLVQVVDRSTEEEVERVKLAEIFIPIQVSYDTNTDLSELALDIADSTEAISFEEAATSLGLTMQSTGLFDPSGFVPGLQRVTAARDFAQRADPGETSRPVETVDAWYVFHLRERDPQRDGRLEDVTSRVRADYLLAERKRLARERAAALLAAAQEGLPLATVVAGDSLAILHEAEDVLRASAVRGVGRDPHVTGAAFAGPDSGLVPQVVIGSQGAYVIEIRRRVPLDEEAFSAAKEQLRMQLLQAKQGQMINSWRQVTRERAQIEDYRPVIASL